ncbi:MAG TPA: hypothetical protein VEX86_00290 [Longimicrobium sp.]|nr:hypothetical protein [Longimicrobium sp.]
MRIAELGAARLPARVALPLAAGVVPADPIGQPDFQEPLSKPHLYQSVPLSALLGTAGGVLGFGLGFVLLNCSDEGRDCASGPDNAEYLAGATGLALGAATGAHFGGLRRDSKGHYGLTLLGAAVGTLPLVFVNKEGDVSAAALVSLAAAPAGAALVDHLARRPRR